MHHVRVDHWSRGNSYFHARDARAKLLALLVYLVFLATTPVPRSALFFVLEMAAYAAVVSIGIAFAKLPFGALEIRAMAVLPFSVTFAVISWISGEPQRALSLVTKSYLSALAVLLVVATTPVPILLRALESLGAPRIFVVTLQFLHRYLFVISEQAQHMRLAAACRQGQRKSHLLDRFRSAAGAVSVLFARSYARSEGIYRAMLSRGFDGRFAPGEVHRFRAADGLFLGASILVAGVIRLAFPLQ